MVPAFFAAGFLVAGSFLLDVFFPVVDFFAEEDLDEAAVFDFEADVFEDFDLDAVFGLGIYFEITVSSTVPILSWIVSIA